MPFPFYLRVLLIALLASVTARPAAAASLPPVPAFEGALLAKHPLAGWIYRTGTADRVDPARLAAALAGADFVLLGEKHDNPDHHRLQAWAVSALASAGRRPAVVWEMITADQAPALATYQASPTPNAAGLGPAIGWEKTGWPAWSFYQPIAVAALAGGMAIVPGDLERSVIRAVSRQGATAQDALWRSRLG